MSTWSDAITFVLSYEGGYVNSPLDAGGETKYGISKRAYPSLDIATLTVEAASEIYKRDYWMPCHCAELPGPLAIAVFDCAVNQGVRTACRLLQVSLDVTVDGEIGPQTVSAAFKQGPKAVTIFLLERAKNYMQIKDVVTWGANWGERLVRLAKLTVPEASYGS